MALPISDADAQTAFETLDKDLRTLFRLVVAQDRPIFDGDIRAASVILRRWISEQWISKLAKVLGWSVTLPILDNTAIVRSLQSGAAANYFLTGGIRFNGKLVQGVYDSNGPPPAVPVLPIDKMSFKMVKPGEFAKQKRVYHGGTWFTCDEIVRFISNKTGGAHLEFNRDEKESLLEAASNYMTYGGPLSKMSSLPRGPVYLELEPNGTEILSGFQVEIIAAASSLLNIHFDGEPHLRFSTSKNLVSWKRILLGISRFKPKLWSKTT